MPTLLCPAIVKEDKVLQELDQNILHLEYLSKCAEWLRNVYHFAREFVTKSYSFPPLISESQGTSDYAVASMLCAERVFGTIPCFLRNVWNPKRNDSWLREYYAINPDEDKEFVDNLEKVLGIAEKSIACGIVPSEKPPILPNYAYGVWKIFPQEKDALFLIAVRGFHNEDDSNYLFFGRGNYDVIIKKGLEIKYAPEPRLYPINERVSLVEFSELAIRVLKE